MNQFKAKSHYTVAQGLVWGEERMGLPGPIRASRRVSDKTVPFVSYFSGERVVLGEAIISVNAFPEDRIELSPDGDEEIRATDTSRLIRIDKEQHG